MRMSFSGLEISLSGLYTSQKALSVASHNIANAATEGYSRQVAEPVAGRPLGCAGSGMMGTGSEINSINRIRDTYVDYRYWNESESAGEWSVKEAALSDFEMIFNESDDSGFTKVTNDFYTALQDLSKDPSSFPARVALKEKAVALANYFNSTATQLERSQRDYNFGVKSKVDEINSYARQIRDLNDQIYKTELDGTQANDLRDQRQLIVDKLSKLVNVEVSERTEGSLGNGSDTRFCVSINGHALVNHTTLYEIQYTQRTAAQRQNPTDIDGLYNLSWSDGNEFNYSGGELKAYIDIRDGNGDPTTGSENPYKGVPYYMERLNYFVQNFAQNLNEGNSTTNGFEDGYGIDGDTGIKLFTANGILSSAFTDYTTLTAKNISISGDILANDGARKIGASDIYGDAENSNILQDILKQRHDSTMFGEGTPEDFMKSLIATMAVDSQESIKMNELQTSILQNIENKRESISGVSIDEEMTNVVKFQKIYNASAILMQVMSEIYDITLKQLGNS